MLRYFKLIYLFTAFVFFVPVGNAAPVSNCREAIKSLHINKIKIQYIFSDPLNYTKYEGQEGYVLFSKRIKISNRMDYIFRGIGKIKGLFC